MLNTQGILSPDKQKTTTSSSSTLPKEIITQFNTRQVFKKPRAVTMLKLGEYLPVVSYFWNVAVTLQKTFKCNVIKLIARYAPFKIGILPKVTNFNRKTSNQAIRSKLSMWKLSNQLRNIFWKGNYVLCLGTINNNRLCKMCYRVIWQEHRKLRSVGSSVLFYTDIC